MEQLNSTEEFLLVCGEIVKSKKLAPITGS
jgi:hypothetical protein